MSDDQFAEAYRTILAEARLVHADQPMLIYDPKPYATDWPFPKLSLGVRIKVRFRHPIKARGGYWIEVDEYDGYGKEPMTAFFQSQGTPWGIAEWGLSGETSDETLSRRIVRRITTSGRRILATFDHGASGKEMKRKKRSQ